MEQGGGGRAYSLSACPGTSVPWFLGFGAWSAVGSARSTAHQCNLSVTQCLVNLCICDLPVTHWGPCPRHMLRERCLPSRGGLTLGEVSRWPPPIVGAALGVLSHHKEHSQVSGPVLAAHTCFRGNGALLEGEP